MIASFLIDEKDIISLEVGENSNKGIYVGVNDSDNNVIGGYLDKEDTIQLIEILKKRLKQFNNE